MSENTNMYNDKLWGELGFSIHGDTSKSYKLIIILFVIYFCEFLLIQILTVLYLSEITSEFHTITICLIPDMLSVFYVEYVEEFHTICHMPRYNGLIQSVSKQKPTCRYYVPTMLFYSVHKKYHNRSFVFLNL